MSDSRPFSWSGLAVVIVFVVLGLGLLLVAGAKSLGLGPFSPTPTVVPTATPAGSVVLIDYGRLTRPMPELHVDEPAGAIIMYVEEMAYSVAIESLDAIARLVVLPGDKWVYYFDTTSDSSLYVIFRCPADQFNRPARERICQIATVSPGTVPASILYDLGFESSQ